MRVETKDLTFTYSPKSKALSVQALNGISLIIESGDFYGIIGQTGSGKSTFVQHLNGLIKLCKNCGSIKIGEFDLTDKKCNLKGLRAKVGMVFQYPEYQLFAETVKDDVAFALKNFYSDLNDSQIEEKVKDAVQLVGLDYDRIKDKSPFELSGGQKRRVAIAGVIVARPEILVLDEPVAGLDPQGKKEFIELLHRLHGDVVKTIVIVSHDMDLVAENCNRLAVFSKGEITLEGTPKQVFSNKVKILALGLALPTTAYLSNCLADAGKGIECDLTVDGFINAVVEKFGGERS